MDRSRLSRARRKGAVAGGTSVILRVYECLMTTWRHGRLPSARHPAQWPRRRLSMPDADDLRAEAPSHEIQRHRTARDGLVPHLLRDTFVHGARDRRTGDLEPIATV